VGARSRRDARAVRRGPGTLHVGVVLRAFTWGNVLQLEKVSRLLLADLARRAPLLPGRDTVAFIDIDSTQKRVYGHNKQAQHSAIRRSRGKACWSAG
jgi:hypothetical protein